MRKKISYVISNLNNSLGFEWLAESTDYNRYDVEWIFLNPAVPPLMEKFKNSNLNVKFFKFNGKGDLPAVTIRLWQHFRKTKPDIVHCHLFEASIGGVLAAWLAGVKRRIYTRHHSTLHHTEHPSVVKYDKLVNYFATEIVAVTENVASVLIDMEGVKRDKVTVIHHGFRLEEFRKENVSHDRIQRAMQLYNSKGKQPVIGVISRFVEWKGIQYIIPAFKKLLETWPDALLILANAQGNYEKQINVLLNDLPADSYVRINFENDIFALYRVFDLFIHIPVRKDAEAFGQVYIEAMAAGSCMICTQSGVSPEIVKDNFNAVEVPYNDAAAVYIKMNELLSDRKKIDEIRKNAESSIDNSFSVERMITRLEELYG